MDEVYDKIGLSGKRETLTESTFQTMSNEEYIRPQEYSITYSTGYLDTTQVLVPLEQIYTLLFPRKDCIAEVISEYGLTAKFCIVMNLTDNPEISLSNQFIQLAAFFNAEIEFDTYLNIVDEIIISDDD